MIHGGDHVMLSRKDVRPQQTEILLEAGFLSVSIDYRLCPEVTLLQGAMQDVCSVLQCARDTVPTLHLHRADIHPTGDRVVAVGWSTGGHLAMTLAWSAPALEIAPPDALLVFSCPTDYEDPFWEQLNMPRGAGVEASEVSYDLWEGVRDSPVTAYNPPVSNAFFHYPRHTKDDLIPWQQAQRTYETLCESGVEAELGVVKGAIHLFDASNAFMRNEEAVREFLTRILRAPRRGIFSRAEI